MYYIDRAVFLLPLKFCDFSDDLKKEDGGDVVVDVDSGLAIEGDDEVLGSRSAVSVALEIDKIVPRPEINNEDELTSENVGRGYLLTLDNIKTMLVEAFLCFWNGSNLCKLRVVLLVDMFEQF